MIGMTTNTHEIDAAVTAVLRAEAAAQKLAWPVLAERAGVPKSSMSNYLNDATPLKLGTLDQIASALGLDILEVVRRARERMATVTVVSEPGVPVGESAPTSASATQQPHAEPR